MAARRAGGGAVGLVVATILFAILFVVSTVLAIVFYTQVEGARQNAESYKTKYDEVAMDSELKEPTVAAMMANTETQGTVVGKLAKERNWLAEMITGVSTDRPDQIRQKIRDADSAWQSETLVGRLATFTDTIESKNKTIADLNATDSDELAAAKGELAAAKTSLHSEKAWKPGWMSSRQKQRKLRQNMKRRSNSFS